MGAVSAIPAKVRRVVLERAQGRCEGCGNPQANNLHHRQFRSRGGPHTVNNLVLLCGAGNTNGCHGKAHSADAPTGWAVSSWESPTLIPFQHHVFGLVHLLEDGTTDGTVF